MLPLRSPTLRAHVVGDCGVQFCGRNAHCAGLGAHSKWLQAVRPEPRRRRTRRARCAKCQRVLSEIERCLGVCPACNLHDGPPSANRKTPGGLPEGVLRFELDASWEPELLVLSELIQLARAAAADEGARALQSSTLQSDIIWLGSDESQLQRVTRRPLSWESTIVVHKHPDVQRLFQHDGGTILQAPPRREGSQYWQLHDALLGMAPKIKSLVTECCGADELEGKELGGAQCTVSEYPAKRGKHFDNADIAALLVTITLEGSGTIGIYKGNKKEASLKLGAGQGYILHTEEGLLQRKHGVDTHKGQRVAVTFRFVETIHPLLPEPPRSAPPSPPPVPGVPSTACASSGEAPSGDPVTTP